MPKKEKAWVVEPRTLLDIVAHNEHKLLAASLEDDKEEVIAFRDKFGVSALHTAALYNHLALAKVLIEAGCNVDAQTDVGTAPLHLAADLGHYEMVVLLIDSDANPAPLNDQFEMPLQLARKNKHSRIVVLLEPLVAPLTSKHETALEAAAAGDTLYLVNLVDETKLADGEVFVTPSELSDVTEQGKETLITTILKQEGEAGFTANHASTLDFILLKKLVNVNRTNGQRLTPLMVAVKAGLYEVALKLLKHGADPTLTYDEEDDSTTASSLTQDPEWQLVFTAEEKKYTFETQLELRNTIAFEARPEYVKNMKQYRKEMRIAARDLDNFRRKRDQEALDAANAAAAEEAGEGETINDGGDGGRPPSSGRPASGSNRPGTGSTGRPQSGSARPGSAARPASAGTQ